MNRDYVLYQMTFPEMMLYYSIGVEQHLKLSGLWCGDKTEAKATPPPVLDESANHQAIWEYYHNQQFDPSTWENLVNGK